MKLLHVSSVYNELIEIFERRNINFENLNYTDHLNKFMNFSRGQEFSYSHYLQFYGIETNVFYINYSNLAKKKYLSLNKGNKNFSKLSLLENKIEEFKPNILYLQNSIYFTNQDIVKLKKKFPFIKYIISWICTPLQKEVLSILTCSDLILTCSKEYYKDLIKMHKNVVQINHAYDERNFNQKEFMNKKFELSFCGSIIIKKNFHIKRLNTLTKIKSAIKDINICGDMNFNYKNIFNFKNLNNFYQIKKNIKKPVYGADYFNMLLNSKICINTHADNQQFSGNMRLFDVTGQGCLLLTDKTKDSHQFFIPDKESVEFENPDDAIDKITWLLRNPKKMSEIADNGRKKTLDFFSYKNRCKKISNIINKDLC